MENRGTTLKRLRELFPDIQIREPDDGLTEVVVISRPTTSPSSSSKPPADSSKASPKQK